MRLNRFLIALALLLVSTGVHAQVTIDLCTQWRDYTKAVEAQAIVKDGKFIWVGTKGGLVRFDTTTNTSELFLKTNSGLPVNWVTSLTLDREGALWVGTWMGGVARRLNGTWTRFRTATSGLPSDLILSLAADSAGDVWIGTNEGFARFSGGAITKMGIPNLTPSHKVIRALAVDRSGALWIGASGGGSSLVRWNGTATIFTRSNSELSTEAIFALAAGGDGRIWIGTQYGRLQSFDGLTTWTSEKPSTQAIYSLSVDPAGAVWAASWDGGFKITGNQVERVLGMTATGVVPDGGNVWFGVSTGLARLTNSDPTIFSDFSNSNLAINDIEAITVDQSGRTLVAGADFGDRSNRVQVFDGSKWSHLTAEVSSKGVSRPLALGADSLGNTWVSFMDVGLAKFDGSTWEVFNDTNSPIVTNRVTAITYDKRKNNLWVGTYLTQNRQGSGCAMFDGTTWRGFRGADMGFSGYAEINGIAIDKGGSVWVGAPYQGLSRFDGATWQRFTKTNSPLPDDFVTSVESDKAGSIWVGTANGLAKFDGSTWTIYTTGNSILPTNEVSSIAVDTFGRVWIGTFGKGAVRYDNGTWKLFDQWNSGLTNWNIKRLVADARGHVWFGMTYAGLAEYRPEGFNGELAALFSGDTIAECEGEAVQSVQLVGDGCLGRRIVKQEILGVDAGNYRIIHAASSTDIIRDSISIGFLPTSSRSYSAQLRIQLEDGTIFHVPLKGDSKEQNLLTVHMPDYYNDTIGGEIVVPVVLPHESGSIESFTFRVQYDTTMLELIDATDRFGANRELPATRLDGRAWVTLERSDIEGSDTVAFLRFLVYPLLTPCGTVAIDSADLRFAKGECGVLSTLPMANVCSRVSCGSPTLSKFLRYGLSPRLVFSPNPVVDAASISSSLDLGPVNIEVTDAIGKVHQSAEVILERSKPTTLKFGGLRPGPYWLRVVGNGFVRTIPFVRQ